MILFSAIKGRRKYEIAIGRYKFLHGTNYQRKFDMFQIFDGYFNSVKDDEYEQEYDLLPMVTADNKKLNKKYWGYYKITQHFDLTSDFKLGSKSLMGKYLDLKINQLENSDTIATLNFLLSAFQEDLNEENFIKMELDALCSKLLIKMATVNLIKEDFHRSEFDLTYEEKILFQLEVIKYICENDHLVKDNLIIIDIPILTDEIYHFIRNINNSRIIIAASYPDADIYNYVIVEDKYLDLALEEQFYEIICDNNYFPFTLKEAYEIMEKYLRNEQNEQTNLICRILKSTET